MVEIVKTVDLAIAMKLLPKSLLVAPSPDSFCTLLVCGESPVCGAVVAGTICLCFQELCFCLWLCKLAIYGEWILPPGVACLHMTNRFTTAKHCADMPPK